MITLVTGVPGSGKSYKAVSMISELKDQSKLLHNIDGLKLGTVLEKFCAENDCSPLTLFTNSYHKSNDSFRGWLFVLDECQTLFHKNLKNEDVLRFFQLHRHYGIDIVLLSQDYKLINPSISLLSEYQFRAVSDTANPLPGFLMYRKMVGYEVIGRTFLRKKKSVFNLYKTADFDQEKVRKKARPMLIIFIVCAILAVLGIFKILSFKSGLNSPSSKKGPMTFSENKATRDRWSSSNSIYGQSGTLTPEYPTSYLEKLNNHTLIYLDTIDDPQGTFYLFMNTLWPSKDFPYKTITTRLGTMALIPLDIKIYIESQKSILDESSYLNPNDRVSPKTENLEYDSPP
jgi:zona occludens toxin (predicted ATPase)